MHIPLPGERLVAFLSDGAFEKQRGSDWAPRGWRAEDCGVVGPVMIKNGRRIDQRTTMSQQGGATWFVRHLRLNGFDPLVFDGRDPAAFVSAILEAERRLEAAVADARNGRRKYPVPLPYGVALAPKGYGFPGAGPSSRTTFVAARGLEAPAQALGWGAFLATSLPVTIGNVVGGTLLVGAVYWFIYLRPRRES